MQIAFLCQMGLGRFVQNFRNLKKNLHQFVFYLFVAGIAGGVAAALTTPLDCVKTVLNTQQTPQFDTGYRLLYHRSRAVSYR